MQATPPPEVQLASAVLVFHAVALIVDVTGRCYGNRSRILNNKGVGPEIHDYIKVLTPGITVDNGIEVLEAVHLVLS